MKSLNTNFWFLLIILTNLMWTYFSTALSIDRCAHIWVMVHTSRSYQYASYDRRSFKKIECFPQKLTSNCMQSLYDMKILRTHRKCPPCNILMTLTECSTTKYRQLLLEVLVQKNYCPRVGSVLQQNRVTYGEFGKILANFSKGNSVKTAAEQANFAACREHCPEVF